MNKPSRTRIVRANNVKSFSNVRSVVGRMLMLQAAIVLLLTVSAVVWMVQTDRRDAASDAASQSLGVAMSFAHAPGMVTALKSSDPTAVLQPRIDAVQKGSGVDFINVFDSDGSLHTRPAPDVKARLTANSLASLRAGQTIQGQFAGPRGDVRRAVVPIKDTDGAVVGAVAVGVLEKNVSAQISRQLPAVLGTAAAAVAATTAGAALASRRLLRQTRGLGPAEITRLYEHHDAVLHAAREGVVIVDDGRRVLLVNDEARQLLDLPADSQGRPVRELPLTPPIAELLDTGREASDEVHLVGGRVLAVNQRSLDRYGVPSGTVTTLRDSTELQALSGRVEAAAGRLRVLYDATVSIGTSLDVTQTAGELADVAVPQFADHVTVDLVEQVLHGNEPPAGAQNLRRIAANPAHPGSGIHPVGESISFHPSSPQATGVTSQHPVVEPDLRRAPKPWAQSEERAQRMLDQGFHSLITAPLCAGGAVLGVADFWRSQNHQAFDADDQALAEELAARTAICIDNARRYTREHAMAVTLQRSLLPRTLPEQSALTIAYRYLPAQEGVGGDWFDVIPLPGARVALVVGDVVGHGLHAAATMGRLRTAVRNFSSLDLPPDELLARIDELSSSDDSTQGTAESDAMVGATCLYVVYDPVAQRCTMARAGHPPPILLHADRAAEVLEVPAGPPLGVGGLPFEACEVEVPEDSTLALYTDGLVERRDRDIDEGIGVLRHTLTRASGDLDEACGEALEALLPDRAEDDVVLILARAHAFPAHRVARWDVPHDPAAVGQVRTAATNQLAAWGLEDLTFVTELVLSELVTNAIRYTTGPISLRLLLDRQLICEVFDSSSTAPHLRYAETTDEGGRGLFLVAQLADRWGVRYTPAGKIIWTEQSLTDDSGEGTATSRLLGPI
ncbi:SpoIIE family protein phosphatase [Streptomyces sp. NPDC057684]|uniref:SpoIIE family protein phosphatase n=1 Tax=Streptomyces sp. NPDC057684 TaxID=3346211 RepID=UPI00368AE7DF